VFAPRWRFTQRIVHVCIVLLCATHLGMFAATLRIAPEGAGGQTLDAVQRMFGSPWLALLCWVHYLAFDMFVGAWMVRDAIERQVPRWVLAPCTVVTLFLGPTGLALYLALRKVQGDHRLPVSQST
jgi:succinate dehydrogenase hydrophobic anchor subunit